MRKAIERYAACAAALVAAWGILIPPVLGQGMTFYENLHFQIFMGDSLDARARLYDGEDYQRMLLLPGSGPPMLLELGAGMVYELPPDAVDLSVENPVLLSAEAGILAAEFANEEGEITFTGPSGIPCRVGPMPPLVGEASWEELLALKPAYGLDAEEYEPKAESLNALKSIDRPLEFVVFFGTWCQLCKQIVPSFTKTIEEAGNQGFAVTYVALDEAMEAPAEWIDRFKIGKTPTIIVSENGREIGRIEEDVPSTVEEELVEIVDGS
jgi:thiol-disulfide isomerase/thioredoxin